MEAKKIRRILDIVVLPTAILLWSAWYVFGIKGAAFKDLILIKPIFFLMAILYVINGYTDFRAIPKAESEQKVIKKGLVLFIIGIICYLVLLSYIGFILCTLAFMVYSLWILQVRSKVLLIALPVIFTIVLYVIFKIGFAVPLPSGFMPF